MEKFEIQLKIAFSLLIYGTRGKNTSLTVYLSNSRILAL